MAVSKRKGCLITAAIWLVILGLVGAGVRFFLLPRLNIKLWHQTGSESQYRSEVKIAVDSFSGYCVLRSPTVRNQLRSHGVKLTLIDDGADYVARINALKDGSVQMAVFTIDSLLKAGARAGTHPASIVLVIDETCGADAIVAYKTAVSSIQELDNPNARLVLTPDSPSEFLARVVLAHFSLPSLPEKWWVEADGAADVHKRFRAAGRNEKRAYVLWEPYVSKALAEPDTHVLLDSARLKGYIVDVLVARREFLRDSPDLVREVVEASLRATYSYSQQDNGMAALILEDAKTAGGESLTDEQSAKLARTILWRNTLENYAHFGLLSSSEERGLQHMEDMIGNIAGVLVDTGAVSRQQLPEATDLFFSKILGDLQSKGFHPGRKVNVLEVPGTPLVEPVRGDSELPALSAAEWDRLVEVGALKAEPIAFGRGTADITVESQRDLDALAHNLRAWPQYYLLVIGHTMAVGDPEANRQLAQARADAVAAYLASKGIYEDRLKARAAPTQGEGSASVSFIAGQVPY